MSLTLLDLRTEVQARGFDYVSDTRLDYWINRAYHTFCNREAWPFLETTTTGASPLTISDFRAALSVTDTTNGNTLESEDYRTLREWDPGLDDTGSPVYWYMSGSAMTTWPTDSVSLSVTYIKVPDDLTATDDTPLIPARFHYALVDGALVYAYKDSDNLEASSAIKNDFEEAILEATDSLLVVNYDQAKSIAVSDSSTDW